MARTLQTFLAEQDAAVLASFLDIDWCICAAISRGALEDLAGKRSARVEDLPGYGAGDVAVVRRAGHAELWVRARLADYQAPFLDFAAKVAGFAPGRVPAGWNVDHLFSKARVQTPSGLEDDRLPITTLVRMQLVDRAVNQSFGGLMEGAMVGSGNPNRPVRRFTYLQVVKALSIHANIHGGGFGGANLIANLGHVVAELDKRGVIAGLGMDRAQIMTALQSEAAKVQHFRALRG